MVCIAHPEIICLVCPFFRGIENGRIKCVIYPGELYQLEKPSECAMLKIEGWNEIEIHKAIKIEAGEEWLHEFIKKQKSL